MTADGRDKAIELAKDFIKYKSYSSTVLTVSEAFLFECDAREKAVRERDDLLNGLKVVKQELADLKQLISHDPAGIRLALLIEQRDERANSVIFYRKGCATLSEELAEVKKLSEVSAEDYQKLMQDNKRLEAQFADSMMNLEDVLLELKEANIERDTFCLTAKLNGEDLFVAKAENARLIKALTEIAAFDFLLDVFHTPSQSPSMRIARQALASSTSGKELLSAVRMAIEALGSSEMMLGASIYFESRHRSDDQSRYRADLVESEKLTKQALSDLKKVLGE